MSVIHITNGPAQIEALTANDHLTIIDFHAQWCGPCKSISPMLEALTQPRQGDTRHVQLLKVDVDDPGNEELSHQFNIRAMPTLVWVLDAQIKHRLEGANRAEIEAVTNQLRHA